jgi:hypothetical protein
MVCAYLLLLILVTQQIQHLKFLTLQKRTACFSAFVRCMCLDECCGAPYAYHETLNFENKENLNMQEAKEYTNQEKISTQEKYI